MDLWTRYAKFPFNDAVNHYKIFVAHPWLWKLSYDFVAFPVTRLFSEVIGHVTSYESFKEAIEERDPDLVVSVHPLCQSMPTRIVKEYNARLAVTRPDRLPTAFATVVTDLIDGHQTWFSADADAIFVPTDIMRKHCVEGGSGADPARVVTYGLPVRPVFWNPPNTSKASLRRELRMKDMCTVLLMAGGDGVGALVDIVSAVAKKMTGVKATQLVVICGSNTEMVTLKSLKYFSITTST